MVSLDGYIEGPNGELDWHNVDEEFNDYAICMLQKVDTLLFGRKTYEMMAAYWPSDYAVENDPVVAEKMNTLDKIVVSSTMEHAGWTNTRLIKENAAAEIMKLKQEAGKDIALFGSSGLALTLIKENLVDEYRIITTPTALGSGKSIFEGLDSKLDLKLSKTWIFNSGNVLNYYHTLRSN